MRTKWTKAALAVLVKSEVITPDEALQMLALQVARERLACLQNR
jgi:hypothetical protein